MVDKIAAFREKFFEDWYQFNSTTYFIVVCILYYATTLLKRVFIIDEIAAFEILQERGEMWIFDLFYGFQYLSIPVFLAWKFTVTAFLLWVGCFGFGYRIHFQDLWRWVMFCEVIFVFPEFLKIIWFLFYPGDPSYQDVVAFYPLSLMNLVDYQQVADQWHYPLKALNIFEPVYWLALTIGIFYLSKKKWHISRLIVGLSYVFFFLAWLGYYILVYK
jgi:hypothetical protein